MLNTDPGRELFAKNAKVLRRGLSSTWPLLWKPTWKDKGMCSSFTHTPTIRTRWLILICIVSGFLTRRVLNDPTPAITRISSTRLRSASSTAVSLNAHDAQSSCPDGGADPSGWEHTYGSQPSRGCQSSSSHEWWHSHPTGPQDTGAFMARSPVMVASPVARSHEWWHTYGSQPSRGCQSSSSHECAAAYFTREHRIPQKPCWWNNAGSHRSQDMVEELDWTLSMARSPEESVIVLLD